MIYEESTQGHVFTVPIPVASYQSDMQNIEREFPPFEIDLNPQLCTELRELAPHVTTAQIAQIKSQITAYQLIKRGQTIPNDLLDLLGIESTLRMDWTVVMRERDDIINKQLCYRSAALYSVMNQLSAPMQTKALIEMKAIGLLDLQKQVRAEVLSVMKQSCGLEGTKGSKRVKRQTLRDARISERIEKQERMECQRLRRQQYMEYLLRVQQHHRVMRESMRCRGVKLSKINRGILNYHANTEREQKKEEERIRKERMRRLMAEDEVGYRKLIDQKKDHRLNYLLEQTDQYMANMAKLLQSHKMSTEEVVDRKDCVVPSDKDDVGVDCYAIAHFYREKIERQPSIMTGGTLKSYQLFGLEWMVSLYINNINGILADEMGLGKTIQTISLVAYLLEIKRVMGPHLIVVPLSTLSNWVNEFAKWTPSVVVVAYRGTPQVRRDAALKMRASNLNVVITTYDYIIRDRNVLSKMHWVYLVVDEGHRMKNHSCKLTHILSNKFHVPYRLLLTGTPLQNRLPELWALLNFIQPTIFNSCGSFEQWFNAPLGNTTEKVELNQEESILVIHRLHAMLRPFLLRRLKKEVESQLPDKVEYIIKCALSPLQRIMYKHMHTSGVLLTNDGTKVVGRSLSNTLMQLRKICNHPFMFEPVERSLAQHSSLITGPLIYRVSGKFEVLDRILPKLKATDHKCLLFCQMTTLMNILEDYLNYRNFSHLRLDGSTKAEDREFLLAQFNDPQLDTFIFLLSTRAGGLGLNLQTADTVIIFDSDWNPHQDLQAEDRAHRIGQLRQVRVLRLMTVNSVEERILSAAKNKLCMDDKVIRAGMFDQKSTSDERKRFLQSLLDTNTDSNEDVDCVHDDDALNIMLMRSDEEYELFSQMDAQRLQTETDSRLITEDELPIWLLDAANTDYVPQETCYSSQRHRKSREAPSRILEDEESSYSEDSIPRRPKRVAKPAKPDVSSVLTQLLNYIVEYIDENDRALIDPFLELPSKRDLPDYYEIIKKPVDVKRIKSRIKLGKYSSVSDFCDDVVLMFANAQVYNIEESLIYEDSVVLSEVFLEKKKELCGE